MNWWNIVVLYNLNASHTLLHSVRNHTEPPSSRIKMERGVDVGGDDWWSTTAIYVFIFGTSLKYWCKQPWQAAGGRIQRHLFLRVSLIRPERGDKKWWASRIWQRLLCSQVRTVVWNVRGERSTALHLHWRLPPPNDPHEPRPLSNKIHPSVHPTLPSLYQRIRPPSAMKDTHTHTFILLRSWPSCCCIPVVKSTTKKSQKKTKNLCILVRTVMKKCRIEIKYSYTLRKREKLWVKVSWHIFFLYRCSENTVSHGEKSFSLEIYYQIAFFWIND